MLAPRRELIRGVIPCVAPSHSHRFLIGETEHFTSWDHSWAASARLSLVYIQPKEDSLVDIVITGRRMDVSDRFKRFAEEKLTKVTQFAPRAHRIDVELSHERNPRQSHTCEKVEITVRDKGPVIRAEACAEDAMAAMDLASAKLLERLRRMGDRKKVHHGRQTPASVRSAEPHIHGERGPGGTAIAAAVSGVGLAVAERPADVHTHSSLDDPDSVEPRRADLPEGAQELADSPVVIRTKDHEAHPMTIDQALYEMELVGHDFYLFIDAACDKPSVVYRRRGWNYGVIRLSAGASITGTIGAELAAAP